MVAERPVPDTVAPFLRVRTDYLRGIRSVIAAMTDEGIEEVLEQFKLANLKNIHHDFWVVAPTVRIFARKEQERRAAERQKEAEA